MVHDQGYLGPTKFSEDERSDFAEPKLSGLAERDGHVSKHKPHGLLESHFNVSVGSDGQSHKTVSTNHNLFEEKRRAEAVSNRGPSAYQPNALPLGQTGSEGVK